MNKKDYHQQIRRNSAPLRHISHLLWSFAHIIRWLGAVVNTPEPFRKWTIHVRKQCSGSAAQNNQSLFPEN